MPPKMKKEKENERKVSPPLKEKDKDAAGRRRNRVPISCTICRRRKVKCDKKRPVCTACERTGVAHLCHYIDPPWAQPLSNAEMTAGSAAQPDDDQSEVVEKLKEKIRQLEAQLANGSSPSTSVDDSDSCSEPQLRQQRREASPSDNLNLGKKFDMLHIKSTTTVHLGTTSWLAIMKGDPYLRVLWAHIFKLRKQAEEMKFKRGAVTHQNNQFAFPPPPVQRAQSTSFQPPQPVHAQFTSTESPIPTCPVSGKNLTQGKCPVIHAAGKCPVTHQMASPSPSPAQSLPEPKTSSSSNDACPVSGRTADSGGKCPVAHMLSETEKESKGMEIRKRDTDNRDGSFKRARISEPDNEDEKETQDGDQKTSQSLPGPTDRAEARVCPLMIGDNSFLDDPAMVSGNPTMSPENKRNKRRTNSNDSSTTAQPKASPEDFKKNPVAMMQAYLPKKKIFWMLIDRFFEILYIYMPFVDESSFREELKFIFGAPGDKDQTITIKIRSGVDFALVGTTCIILRLTWNTLPKNNLNKLLKSSSTIKSYPEDQEKLKLLQDPENEISIDLVDCVKHCFSNLKLMRRSSLKIVQCALYMRLYFLYSPEDGDGADGSDSQIFLGMIIQMAISIGLHRDPKNFENFSNEKQRHLWRKIWYELVSLDIQQSMNLGCPRCLQNFQEYSDTSLPGETEDGLDLVEFEKDIRELTVIKNTHTKFNIDKQIAKVMKVLLNVNEPAKRYQLDQLIESLQKSINGFGTSNDKYALRQLGKILVNRTKSESIASSATRGLEFRLHVTVNMLIYLLNYILFVHFEPKGSSDPHAASLAKNYAQRALDCALEGYRNCTLFFDCGLEYFGPGTDLILSPLLLLVGHRSIQFMVSLILRSRCGPFMKPNVVRDPGNDVATPRNTANPKHFGMMNLEHGYQNIDNSNHDLNNVELTDRTVEYASIFNVDVNSGEILATILLQHMDKFHDLANVLGEKYHYSWRMGKAVGFFVTLLKKPINVVKSIVKTENVTHVENGTGNVTSILNSVPLTLSTEEEELRRKCPLKVENQNLTIPDGPSPMVRRFSTQSSQFGVSPGPAVENTFMYQAEHQLNASAPTPQAGVPQGSFSLAFNAQSSAESNPINSIDLEMNEQFPELMQAADGGAFNSNISELFGIPSTSMNDTSPLTNPIMGSMNMFSDMGMGATDLGGSSNSGNGNGAADMNMMMGSWFS